MSGSGTVKIEERWRGTRGGHYIYVVEGDELVHISEYAIEKFPEKFGDYITYKVPLQKVSGKVLYCFDFSNSGASEFICKCRIEDFEDGLPKRYEDFALLEERVREIRNLKFRVKDHELSDLISEFYKLFVLMVQEIKKYEEEKGFECFFGHARRLGDAFRDPELYYFTFMSLPNDESRIRSLRVTRRWIYQLWVLKLLCECLQVSRFSYYVYEGKPYWWIEQGSDFSTCIGETPFGEVTFWLEFQPSKIEHVKVHMEENASGRVAIRPDIVVVRGHFEGTKEFINSKRAIDVLVECKEDPFEEWEGDIESQILPYLENFKPNLFILASLKPVPVGVRSYLENRGIKVVDELKPNSGNIERLRNILHEGLWGR